MPIFEYLCKECDKQFEAIVTGTKKAHCPACDSTKLEQQFSAFAVGSAKGKAISLNRRRRSQAAVAEAAAIRAVPARVR